MDMAMAMASLLDNNNSKCHVRSVSLPSRSHPTTSEIEQKINNLKPSGSVQANLSGLLDLYMFVNDMLNLASTHQALSYNKTDKWVDELLEGSVKLLDICGITKEFVTQIKEHVQALRFSVRRGKGDSSIESNVVKYTNCRKKMKKDARKFNATLKQMDNILVASSTFPNQNDQIRLLREVYGLSICIFQSLLSFLSTSISSTKQSKWSLVSKLMHKGAISCEAKQGNVNELEDVDTSLCNLCKLLSNREVDAETLQAAQKQLEALEIGVGSFEDDLECMFRRLIHTRASLLNIISK